MTDQRLTTDAIQQALDGFQDPETGRGIFSLGQVHKLNLEKDRLAVTLGLTTFSAPLWESTRAELVDYLKGRFPELSEIAVDLAVHQRPAEKIGEIGLAVKSVIAVGSGKGGVGKSTVAAAMAIGLSKAGAKVGLMDADVYGPSIPHLLGSSDQPGMVGQKIQPVVVDGVAAMSMGFMVPANEAMVWRGPMLHGAITQLLRDTDWGELDYLLIDMPPGTGDVAITLAQLLPLSGVVVCTPQEVALLDAVRAIAMFRKIDIDIVGMVENMSHFICPDCSGRHEIFGSGGAKRKAAELDVPFLGEVPINTQLRISGDEGRIGSMLDDEVSGPYLKELCSNLVRKLVKGRKQKPPMPTLSVLG